MASKWLSQKEWEEKIKILKKVKLPRSTDLDLADERIIRVNKSVSVGIKSVEPLLVYDVRGVAHGFERGKGFLRIKGN